MAPFGITFGPFGTDAFHFWLSPSTYSSSPPWRPFWYPSPMWSSSLGLSLYSVISTGSVLPVCSHNRLHLLSSLYAFCSPAIRTVFSPTRRAQYICHTPTEIRPTYSRTNSQSCPGPPCSSRRSESSQSSRRQTCIAKFAPEGLHW